MVNKETALQKITALVARFKEQIGSYKHSDYNETLTRRDFIDPFFKALGWDMDNENGYAEAYREVIHEDKLKIGSATKAPDYSFRLPGGKRLFFVEAKKPSVFVKEEMPPAYQVRRYGWSAKMPISIITDFEEFSIYDCTKKPKTTDKASTARIKYLTYIEYLNEFDFIWETFSKEKVLKGSFDKFVLSDTGKKGTTTVDKEFLESLNEWRKLLAESISLKNKKLNESEINFAVQQTIDRIIFLRIAEDRSVEPYGKLKDALRKGDYYKNLFEYFEEADRVYNSGLFDFKKDELSKYLKIENSVLEKIINELYYPESPYEFSVLSVEILGSAYEQFLGKVIRLASGHKAKIEEKPEVRKAGGVYYTPQYIVDYIVKNTVGKLVEGKTPKEVEKLKIVDPACGSGSFLIGAFQYLLDWHLNYYMGKGAKEKTLTPDGRLTTAEKKKILINNIYGVDIDTQAVEVTKLSLLLKCMEGETQASVQQTMGFMHERVLPTLDNNIRCGNSLIDTDFYDGELEFKPHKTPKTSEDTGIKPFNWQASFNEVFKQGGFDCVIGNPPYVNIRNLTYSKQAEAKTYFTKKFFTAYKGYDLYVLFIEKALSLLNKNGTLGYIIPNKFATLDYGFNTRKLLLEQHTITEICDVSNLNIFGSVSVYPYLFFVANKKESNNKISIVKCEVKSDLYDKLREKIKQTDFLKSNYNISLNSKTKIEPKNFVLLKDICKVQAGTTGFLATKTKDCITENGKGGLDFIVTGNIDRYLIRLGNVRYINKIFNKPKITNKKNIITSGKWNLFSNPKIVIGGMTKTIEAAYDNVGIAVGVGVYCLTEIKHNPKFVLGILNSKFSTYFFTNEFEAKHLAGGYLAINVGQLELIPFPKDVSDVKIDEMIKLVDTMVKLQKELKTAKLPDDKEQIQQRIDHTDRRIDKLVYELYGLKEEEIKVVEGV